jgi:hypothetical protein
MPFKSEKQRKWMYANLPEMATKWEKHTGKRKLPEKVHKVASLYGLGAYKGMSMQQLQACIGVHGLFGGDPAGPKGVEGMSKRSVYAPPWGLDKLPKRLHTDPVHSWRAINGIELIHEEPTFNEFQRIWKNWDLMSPEQKVLSDAISVKLFGVDNKTHYDQLYALMQNKAGQTTKNMVKQP